MGRLFQVALVLKLPQDLFQVEALKVNTRITKEGKLAIVTLTADHSAEDLSNRLGIL